MLHAYHACHAQGLPLQGSHSGVHLECPLAAWSISMRQHQHQPCQTTAAMRPICQSRISFSLHSAGKTTHIHWLLEGLQQPQIHTSTRSPIECQQPTATQFRTFLHTMPWNIRCVQWSEDMIKADPAYEGLGPDSAPPPPRFQTQLCVSTLISTGGGFAGCVQLSDGGFQVV